MTRLSLFFTLLDRLVMPFTAEITIKLLLKKGTKKKALVLEKGTGARKRH